MSTTLTDIETNVRYLLGDYSQNMIPGDIFTYENSAIFTLSEGNIVSVSSVLKNDVELTSGQYSYDSSTNKVTISASLSSGDTIEIQYSYYPNYSQNEIYNYIRAAIIHLGLNHYYNFEIQSNTIYPDPSTNDKNIISMVAALLIEPDNKSYSLPDIKISVPSDLPIHQKISKIVAVAKKDTHGNFQILNNS